MSKKDQLEMLFGLINAFSIAKTPVENTLLMQDLLTAVNKNLSRRFRTAKMIISGETQREIAQEIHSSLSTVTTVTKVSL